MDETHGGDEAGRTTSPMQAFDGRDVAVGLAVLAVGVLVAFGLPVLLA